MKTNRAADGHFREAVGVQTIAKAAEVGQVQGVEAVDHHNVNVFALAAVDLTVDPGGGECVVVCLVMTMDATRVHG
jgi:hypothetical protein